jgi:hypothetical protein
MVNWSSKCNTTGVFEYQILKLFIAIIKLACVRTFAYQTVGSGLAKAHFVREASCILVSFKNLAGSDAAECANKGYVPDSLPYWYPTWYRLGVEKPNFA